MLSLGSLDESSDFWFSCLISECTSECPQACHQYSGQTRGGGGQGEECQYLRQYNILCKKGVKGLYLRASAGGGGGRSRVENAILGRQEILFLAKKKQRTCESPALAGSWASS